MPTRRPAIVAQVSCGYLRYFQLNAVIIFKIDQFLFLVHFFKFIIQTFSVNSSCVTYAFEIASEN